MEQPLRDKVAFVTGSAHRVGKGILLGLARAGARLVLHYCNGHAQAQQTADEARTLGAEVLVVQGDHARHEEVARNFSEIEAHYGRLDLLVNSASIYRGGDWLTIPPDEWRHLLDVNLSGPFWCTQHAALLMRRLSIPGVIVHIADNSGVVPRLNHRPHGFGKAALLMLARVGALELAPYGIRVNALVLGPVLPSARDDVEQIAERVPLKRWGSLDDVARGVLYLATNDFVTGSVLHVDGGESLARDPC